MKNDMKQVILMKYLPIAIYFKLDTMKNSEIKYVGSVLKYLLMAIFNQIFLLDLI